MTSEDQVRNFTKTIREFGRANDDEFYHFRRRIEAQILESETYRNAPDRVKREVSCYLYGYLAGRFPDHSFS